MEENLLPPPPKKGNVKSEDLLLPPPPKKVTINEQTPIKDVSPFGELKLPQQTTPSDLSPEQEQRTQRAEQQLKTTPIDKKYVEIADNIQKVSKQWNDSKKALETNISHKTLLEDKFVDPSTTEEEKAQIQLAYPQVKADAENAQLAETQNRKSAIELQKAKSTLNKVYDVNAKLNMDYNDNALKATGNMLTHVYNALPETVGGVGALTKSVGSVFEPTNPLYNIIGDGIKKMGDGLKVETDAKYDDKHYITSTIGDIVGSVAVSAIPGGLVGKAGKVASMITGASTATAQMADGIYDKAKEAGLSEKDSGIMTLAIAPVSGLLEVWGASNIIDNIAGKKAIKELMDYSVKNLAGKTVTKEMIFNTVSDGFKKVGKKYGISGLKSAGEEGLTELAQAEIESGGENIYDIGKGKEAYGTKFFSTKAQIDALKQAAIGAVAGTAFGVISGVSKPKNLYTKAMELNSNPEQLAKFQDMLNTEVEAEHITQEHADNINNNINAIINIDKTIPPTIKDEEKRSQAVELVTERNTLVQENEKLTEESNTYDAAFTTPQQELIAKNEEQISKINSNLQELAKPVQEEVKKEETNNQEYQEKVKEITGYDKFKSVEGNDRLIKTAETIVDKDYEPNDVENKRTKAYQIQYNVRWNDMETSSNPDVETFDTIDEAYDDAQKEGEWWNGNQEHLKTIEPVFKEVWLNSDGSIYEETDNVLNSEEFENTKEGQSFKKEMNLSKYQELSTIYNKGFGTRDDNARKLESEVYQNLGANLETSFKADNGETYEIKHGKKGKYSTLNIIDKNGDEIDAIKLRIADHTYNPANNDSDAKSGKFISVEISNANPTKDRFNTRYSLGFDGENSYDQVLESVKERLNEILENNIKFPKEEVKASIVQETPIVAETKIEETKPETKKESEPLTTDEKDELEVLTQIKKHNGQLSSEGNLRLIELKIKEHKQQNTVKQDTSKHNKLNTYRLVRKYNSLKKTDKNSLQAKMLLNKINESNKELGHTLKVRKDGNFTLIDEHGKEVRRRGIVRAKDVIEEEKRVEARQKRALTKAPNTIHEAVAQDIANGVKFDHQELKDVTGLTDADIPFGYTRKDGKGQKLEFYKQNIADRGGENDGEYNDSDMEEISKIGDIVAFYMQKGGREDALNYIDEQLQKEENSGFTEKEMQEMSESVPDVNMDEILHDIDFMTDEEIGKLVDEVKSIGTFTDSWNGTQKAIKESTTLDEALKNSLANLKDSEYYKSKSDIGKSILEEQVSHEAKDLYNKKDQSKTSGIKVKKARAEGVTAPIDNNSTDEEIQARGKESYDEDPNNAKNIVFQILDPKSGKTVLEPDEVPELIYYKTVLDNDQTAAYAKRKQLVEDGKSTSGIDKEIEDRKSEIYDYNVMSLITGRQQSLAFRLRKGLRDSNTFNVVSEIEEYKRKGDGTIPKDVEDRIKKVGKELEGLKTEIDKLTLENDRKVDQQQVQNIIDQIAREKKPIGNNSSKGRTATKILADKFRKKYKSKEHKFTITDENGNDIITDVNAVQQGWISQDAIVELIAKAIEATGSIADAIVNVKEQLQSKDWYKKLSKENQTSLEKQIVDSINEEEGILITKKDGKLNIPLKLVKNVIKSGKKEINELVDAVHEIVSKDFPETTTREVRDAITGYGKEAGKTKADIYVEINQLRTLGRLLSKKEDLENGILPFAVRKNLVKQSAYEIKLRDQIKTLQTALNISDKAPKVELSDIQKSANRVERLKEQLDKLKRKEVDNDKKESRKKSDEEKFYEGEILKEKEKLGLIQAKELKLPKTQAEIDDAKTKLLIKNIVKSISDIETNIKNKELEFKTKNPPKSTELLKELRENLKVAQKQLKTERDKAGVTERKKELVATTRVNTLIAKRKEQLKTGIFPEKKTTALNLENTPLNKLRAQSEKLLEDIREVQYKNEVDNRLWPEVLKKESFKIAGGLLRGLVAGADLSATLVQGGMRAFVHPKDAMNGFINGLKAWGSTHKADEFLNDIKSQEWYPMMKASGLNLIEDTYKLKIDEEQPAGNLIGMVWNLPANAIEKVFRKNKGTQLWKDINVYKAAQRAYATNVNYIRVQAFLEMANKMKDQGVDLKTDKVRLKALGDFVNTFTGRAGFGKAEVLGEYAGMAFFSLRRQVAAMKMISPYALYYYGSMPTHIRRYAVMESVKAIGAIAVTAITGQALLGDDDWDEFFNPNSPNYFCIKVPGEDGSFTTVNLFGAIKSLVVAMNRIRTGRFTSASTGKTELLGTRYGKPINTELDVLGDYFKNKVNPGVGILFKVLGQTEGNELDYTELTQESAVPMWTRDVASIYKDHPEVVASLLTALNLLGAGVQHYQSNQSKEEDKMNKAIKKMEKEADGENMEKEKLKIENQLKGL